MRIGFVEPHLGVYGGIRRILEFSNRWVDRGESVVIYHPTGEPCAWMPCRAEVRPLAGLRDAPHDVLIFNNPPDYRHVRAARAGLKVFYILELYDHDRLLRFDPRIFWPRKGRMLSLQRCLQMPWLMVANATWIQAWLREHMGMEVRLALGGVNRDLFHPVERPARGSGPFRILCSGDPREHKGTETVRAAVAEVARVHDVTLDSYHGKGIPQPGMAAVYANADLFVDAQWHAGWNNPVVEAMACGTPVVCSDIGGVRDFAFHERTALLAPPRDAPAFARSIARMIEDPVLRARLAAGALAEVERFDWDRAADGFLDLLYREAGMTRVRAAGERP